jgi:hypothetical protein
MTPCPQTTAGQREPRFLEPGGHTAYGGIVSYRMIRFFRRAIGRLERSPVVRFGTVSTFVVGRVSEEDG